MGIEQPDQLRSRINTYLVKDVIQMSFHGLFLYTQKSPYLLVRQIPDNKDSDDFLLSLSQAELVQTILNIDFLLRRLPVGHDQSVNLILEDNVEKGKEKSGIDKNFYAPAG